MNLTFSIYKNIADAAEAYSGPLVITIDESQLPIIDASGDLIATDINDVRWFIARGTFSVARGVPVTQVTD